MYKQIYKGQEISVTYVWTDDNKKMWYCQVNGGEANDWVSLKRDAIAAAKEMIDNPETYGLILN